jgi:hypothetical protein
VEAQEKETGAVGAFLGQFLLENSLIGRRLEGLPMKAAGFPWQLIFRDLTLENNCLLDIFPQLGYIF